MARLVEALAVVSDGPSTSPGFQGNQVPAVLGLLDPPRLALGDRLGVRVRLVLETASGVPLLLGEHAAGDPLGLLGVAVDRHHAAGQHHPLDARRAVDRGENIAGPRQGGLDQLPVGVLDPGDDERGRGVHDQLTAPHRLVERAVVQQVGLGQRQSARMIAGQLV